MLTETDEHDASKYRHKVSDITKLRAKFLENSRQTLSLSTRVFEGSLQNRATSQRVFAGTLKRCLQNKQTSSYHSGRVTYCRRKTAGKVFVYVRKRAWEDFSAAERPLLCRGWMQPHVF